MLLLWSLPLIGAGIGWVTNIIAIRLLFRPYQPVTIPFLQIKIQGLLPKRKNELARNIGRTIEEELLSMEEVLAQLKEKGLQEDIKERISILVHERLNDKLSFLPRQIKNHLVIFLGDFIQKELDSSLQDLMDDFGTYLVHESRLGQIIENKVKEFNLETLEGLVKELAQKELRHIEYLGALLGFFIGTIQAILLFYFRPF